MTDYSQIGAGKNYFIPQVTTSSTENWEAVVKIYKEVSSKILKGEIDHKIPFFITLLPGIYYSLFPIEIVTENVFFIGVNSSRDSVRIDCSENSKFPFISSGKSNLFIENVSFYSSNNIDVVLKTKKLSLTNISISCRNINSELNSSMIALKKVHFNANEIFGFSSKDSTYDIKNLDIKAKKVDGCFSNAHTLSTFFDIKIQGNIENCFSGSGADCRFSNFELESKSIKNSFDGDHCTYNKFNIRSDRMEDSFNYSPTFEDHSIYSNFKIKSISIIGFGFNSYSTFSNFEIKSKEIKGFGCNFSKAKFQNCSIESDFLDIFGSGEITVNNCYSISGKNPLSRKCEELLKIKISNSEINHNFSHNTIQAEILSSKLSSDGNIFKRITKESKILNSMFLSNNKNSIEQVEDGAIISGCIIEGKPEIIK